MRLNNSLLAALRVCSAWDEGTVAEGRSLQRRALMRGRGGRARGCSFDDYRAGGYGGEVGAWSRVRSHDRIHVILLIFSSGLMASTNGIGVFRRAIGTPFSG